MATENITTIKLDKKTKSRLDKLKIHKRQTYDELLKEVLNILNICKVNPEGARARLRRIDRIQAMMEKNSKSSEKPASPQHNPQS